MEMDREGFVVVIELDPSCSLVSMRLSTMVRKLSFITSERNGDRLVLAHVAATRGCDSDAWSELQL